MICHINLHCKNYITYDIFRSCKNTQERSITRFIEMSLYLEIAIKWSKLQLSNICKYLNHSLDCTSTVISQVSPQECHPRRLFPKRTQKQNSGKILKIPFSGCLDLVILVSGEIWGDVELPRRISGALMLWNIQYILYSMYNMTCMYNLRIRSKTSRV